MQNPDPEHDATRSFVVWSLMVKNTGQDHLQTPIWPHSELGTWQGTQKQKIQALFLRGNDIVNKQTHVIRKIRHLRKEGACGTKDG